MLGCKGGCGCCLEMVVSKFEGDCREGVFKALKTNPSGKGHSATISSLNGACSKKISFYAAPALLRQLSLCCLKLMEKLFARIFIALVGLSLKLANCISQYNVLHCA